jgi:hypothetical protein
MVGAGGTTVPKNHLMEETATHSFESPEEGEIQRAGGGVPLRKALGAPSGAVAEITSPT